MLVHDFIDEAILEITDEYEGYKSAYNSSDLRDVVKRIKYDNQKNELINLLSNLKSSYSNTDEMDENDPTTWSDFINY